MVIVVLLDLPQIPSSLIPSKLAEMHCQINREAVGNQDEECGHEGQIRAPPLTSCETLDESFELCAFDFSSVKLTMVHIS